ncbi:MAG: 2-oxoacid:acceptor oxidoreductase family protein [Candidatus Nanopelagicales bacterium]|nr:2-oxoacid:acceptor oxidoreductase family protein [Candidatus Nanopelagicales bacterium]
MTQTMDSHPTDDLGLADVGQEPLHSPEAVGSPPYPGVPMVINGNGAVAHVMKHVCGGVIGYPITPSTEISELYEAYRAEGGVNVWGKHPFFFEPEGEHSAQSGALGAALTGGQFISNASSSQGILYAMESHYVTVGKKIGGFVLQVAARVVSKHSLNVMAGHDDVYALLSAGYTILFGSNPQEAADLAAIAYRTSALSLIPVANAMDGFSTSHMLSEARMPEPELLREYLGDPSGRIPCPTVAQELLFGAKGRVFQLEAWLARHRDDLRPADLTALSAHLAANADAVEADAEGALLADTLEWIPEELHGPWRRQWRNAMQQGTRQLVPALVDVHNPGLTGPVQNQPDFQAGAVDHRTHFASAVPGLVRQAMTEYAELTGREYHPVHAYQCEDAEYVMVGLGSITDDVRAVVDHLRGQGVRAGVVSVKLLQPFPEAELVEALRSARVVTVLERSDQTALTGFVTQALFKARANADALAAGAVAQHEGIAAMAATPRLVTAIFGLGGHDVQPRHLIAAYRNMADGAPSPLVYLGSQFFAKEPTGQMAALQAKLKAAYPETELMALETEPNPAMLPAEAMRIRFHSVGGYGTIATGKLLTDVLAGVLGMHSKSAPKYGSEKSGAPTNYYITLSPEPVLITNAELEDVEVVISPDHKAFIHTNPLKGLVEGGTFILQSDLAPEDVWRELPKYARRTIRDRRIRFLVVDAFKVAKAHAPTPDLELRMMGIAFIGAVAAHVDRVVGGASAEAIEAKVRSQIEKKFASKGAAVVEGNMAVIRDGMAATTAVPYDTPEFLVIDEEAGRQLALHSVMTSAEMCGTSSGATALFDPAYYEDLIARPFREGTIGEAPVLPGIGLFMPAGSAAAKDKGLFRLTVPQFHHDLCTGCMECALVCPDAAIPNTVHEVHDLLLAGIRGLDVTEPQRDALRGQVYALAERVRGALREGGEAPFHEVVRDAVATLDVDSPTLRHAFDDLVERLAVFPVARTRPFFDAMEKQTAGTGGLFAATIDPWKCTGCLECIDVCGPAALTPLAQDADVLTGLQERFEFMHDLPPTPKRFYEGAMTGEGDRKRLLLDLPNFYATTGGHGACRGCGEVTAIRLVMSASHALGQERRKAHIRELNELLAALEDKRTSISEDAERVARIDRLVDVLERRLYLYEGGPTGNGPSSTVIANATGCSSVYASTMPFNSYLDPWVNSLFQDTQPLAKGLFEGLSAQAAGDVKAIRLARLELDDAYDPAVHEPELRVLTWEQFTADERAMLPTVMTIGGDGASYDIGFGAMSRVLASDTPIKVLVLNSGAYSNTGGQTSTSSFTGQDSDLARFGGAHHGKHETRKELGLLASFHPNVFACATSTSMHGHFLATTMEMLDYPAPAVMDVYTPCGSEHGISEAHSNARARLAVESRMHPLFVHDPRRGTTLHDWFSLDGNPDVGATWTTSTLQYLDDEGQVQLLTTPLTPAVFALGEVRFKKQFRRLRADEEDAALPIEDYVELAREDRGTRVPYIIATDDEQHLIKVACSEAIVALVEDRRRYWQTLQYLAGVHEAQLTALHKADFESLKAQYDEAMRARETSMDDIARAMSELATASRAPVGAGVGGGLGLGALGGGAPAAAAAPSAEDSCAPAAAGPVWLDPADEAKCTDCGTCYQELPQFFEKATVVIDGAARQIARMIPGSAQSVEVTPDIARRIERVKATCDAEIIR